jgi:hypothetical protein
MNTFLIFDLRFLIGRRDVVLPEANASGLATGAKRRLEKHLARVFMPFLSRKGVDFSPVTRISGGEISHEGRLCLLLLGFPRNEVLVR